jgi:RNA polymerase sigma-70 factor, ECF subfamily
LIYLPAIETVILLLALSKGSDFDESELSLLIKNSDQKAFKQFYDRHYDSIYRFLISRGMSHDEASDLAQKAFLMIWEKRQDIDESKSLRSFLFRIAYTRMLNHIEYHSKFDRNTDPANESLSETVNITERQIDHRELLNRINSLIETMPEKRGTVFQLCFMKEFTYKETAEALNVSLKTVETHMTLAFRELRDGLKKIYGDEIANRFE